jgi:hypothetical protein
MAFNKRRETAFSLAVPNLRFGPYPEKLLLIRVYRDDSVHDVDLDVQSSA